MADKNICRAVLGKSLGMSPRRGPLDFHRADGCTGQVLVKNAGARLADYIDWTGDGKGCNRQAAGHCLEQDQTEGIRVTGKDEYIGLIIYFAKLFHLFCPEKPCARIVSFHAL